MERLVRHLAAVQPEKLGDELRKSAPLWKRCWQQADSLGHDTKRIMLEVLAKSPGANM